MGVSASRKQIGAEPGDFETRVAAVDWDGVSKSLGSYGWAPLGRLLTPSDCARLRCNLRWLRCRRRISVAQKFGAALRRASPLST